jgi:hypothetical protein
MSPELTKKLEAFDTLPNDSVVGDPVASAVLNISLRTLRRNNPVRCIQLSARRIGRRVGDIRALLRASRPPHNERPARAKLTRANLDFQRR